MSIDILNMGMYLNWFQNVSILVMLLLLYNFIPDRFFITKKFHYSVYVGFIFSVAAVLAIFIEWSTSSHSEIGLNAILVPLAGLFGGLVSALIITLFLLICNIFLENNDLFNPLSIILVITAIIGCIFYYLRERHILKISPHWMIALLSISVSITTVSLLYSFSLGDITPGLSIQNPLIQIGIVDIGGLLVLGLVILYIDQNKESDFELLAYKEHLEALVQERTTDLENVNALHQATIESTTDGIVVIDFNGVIQDYNHAATQILDFPLNMVPENTININEILKTKISGFQTTDQIFIDSEYSDQLFSTNLTFNSGNIYELHVTPHQLKGKTIGSVINFRDITKRKLAEDALYTANQKLILLSGITRHDILNQLTALNLYLNLIIEEISDPELIEYVKKSNQIAEVIQRQIEFTRDYPDIGLKKPVWVDLADTFNQATKSFANSDIVFSFQGTNILIYTDPLLERAFYNLIDNSLRHGKHVTSIQLTTIPDGDNLIICYKDNGSGVEPQDKHKIFEEGYGKHTGMGMFLIHEILSITGIHIEETGIYGVGVRFDIHVPAGKFRIQHGETRAL